MRPTSKLCIARSEAAAVAKGSALKSWTASAIDPAMAGIRRANPSATAGFPVRRARRHPHKEQAASSSALSAKSGSDHTAAEMKSRRRQASWSAPSASSRLAPAMTSIAAWRTSTAASPSLPAGGSMSPSLRRMRKSRARARASAVPRPTSIVEGSVWATQAAVPVTRSWSSRAMASLLPHRWSGHQQVPAACSSGRGVGRAGSLSASSWQRDGLRLNRSRTGDSLPDRASRGPARRRRERLPGHHLSIGHDARSPAERGGRRKHGRARRGPS